MFHKRSHRGEGHYVCTYIGIGVEFLTLRSPSQKGKECVFFKIISLGQGLFFLKHMDECISSKGLHSKHEDSPKLANGTIHPVS